jgi:hypothetical protein
MMRQIFMALATACLATTALAKPPEVKADRFEGKIALSSKLQPDMNHMFMVTADIKDGKISDPPTLWLTWFGTEWKYLRCHELHLLVDGKPFPVTALFHSDTNRTITIETEIIQLTREQLARLAAASKIEFKVCNDEGVLPDALLQDIKDFAPVLDEQLKAAATPAPAPDKRSQ